MSLDLNLVAELSRFMPGSSRWIQAIENMGTTMFNEWTTEEFPLDAFLAQQNAWGMRSYRIPTKIRIYPGEANSKFS